MGTALINGSFVVVGGGNEDLGDMSDVMSCGLVVPSICLYRACSTVVAAAVIQQQQQQQHSSVHRMQWVIEGGQRARGDTHM